MATKWQWQRRELAERIKQIYSKLKLEETGKGVKLRGFSSNISILLVADEKENVKGSDNKLYIWFYSTLCKYETKTAKYKCAWNCSTELG